MGSIVPYILSYWLLLERLYWRETLKISTTGRKCWRGLMEFGILSFESHRSNDILFYLIPCALCPLLHALCLCSMRCALPLTPCPLRLTPCTLSRLFRKILPNFVHLVKHLPELVKKGHLLEVPLQRDTSWALWEMGAVNSRCLSFNHTPDLISPKFSSVREIGMVRPSFAHISYANTTETSVPS